MFNWRKKKAVPQPPENGLTPAGGAARPADAATSEALGARSSLPSSDPALSLPPLPPMPSHVPLEAETERAWQECFHKVNDAITTLRSGQGGRHLPEVKPLSADAITKAFALLQTGQKNHAILKVLFCASWQRELTAPIQEFWQRPELSLIHLVRFLVQLDALKPDRQHNQTVLSYGDWLELLFPVFRRAHPDAGLRELAAAFTACGLDARRIGLAILGSYQETPAPLGLPPAQIWPYWLEHLDLLEQAFAPQSGDFLNRFEQRHARRNGFQALAAFPCPPPLLLPVLWKLALGAKSERPLAQRCLEGLPDKFERLVGSLRSGDGDERCAAAEWLGRLRNPAAVDPLLAVLQRERKEAAKSSVMSALQLLGVPVEQFLDRNGLQQEAEKGIAKGLPDGLLSFPFDRLPQVHWANDAKPVEPAILKWWLVQTFKLKSPQPGPLLRTYCASLNQPEREVLGQFVLEAWLAEDTAAISPAEAELRARQQAQQYVQWSQTPYWPKTSPKKTLEEFYLDFLPAFQMQPKGSAVNSKGILALAAACAGPQAVPVVHSYLKQWYGLRAAQCRALLQMLAWVEHKSAIQLLLAVGSRFRTRSIREEANELARALAERKGWTLAELADRTIPTAGLDENGLLTLDFGPRHFIAKMNEDLAFTLTDPDGKALKSLPEPRKDDDPSKAAAAKKLFSAAKKELKSVLSLQRDRFYEAMCTQRTWPFEDWQLYLHCHPIVRHYCQRLVWAVVRDENLIELFRPLPDGSLSNVSDDPVTLVPEDSIRIAHQCLVTQEQSQAWQEHLKDYDVEPLFEQFGRPAFGLAEERKQQEELGDFQGHLLDAFRLRGRAQKLGYTRGWAQDGGWFYDYRKQFPTLGLEAVIEFSGNSLPEENRTVALTVLRFERVASEDDPIAAGAKMTLGELPAVLLSECWNDLRQLAAEGTGFDPEWEKKTQA